jgi:hypothetical protein
VTANNAPPVLSYVPVQSLETPNGK